MYGGLDFEWDIDPDPDVWRRRPVDDKEVAGALADGRIFAWAQGRAEIGPRALGNRSLLAEPSSASTRDRLNEIKQREDYRPIAPVCRIEDAGKFFDTDFEDPYMLYFRMVTSDQLAAVTHVDGTARCQTVSKESNRRLHDLLSAVAERTGVGVLCNTSLNLQGLGFINKTSDLVRYCRRPRARRLRGGRRLVRAHQAVTADSTGPERCDSSLDEYPPRSVRHPSPACSYSH